MRQCLGWIGIILAAAGTHPAGAQAASNFPIIVRNCESATPIPGVTLQITALENGAAFELETDAEGRATLSAAIPGRYRVQLQANGYLDPADPNGQGRWALFGPASDRPVELWLERSATISGRVTSEAGKPVGAIGVFAFRVVQVAGQTRFVRSGAPEFTDDLGRYRLYHLPAGTYIVAATSIAAASAARGVGVAYHPGARDITGARTLDVAPGEEQDSVDILLTGFRSGSVSGTVTGIPPEWSPHTATVALLPRTGIGLPAASATTDTAGRFRLADVPPGDYRAVAWGSAEDDSDAAPHGASARYAVAPITVGDGEDVQTDLALRPGLRIEANWRPERPCTAGVSPTIRPMDGWPEWWTLEGQTQTGNAVWDAVPPGTYQFRASPREAGCTFAGVRASGANPLTQILTITASTSLLAVMAPSTGEITGRREHAGSAIAGARILVWLEGDPGLLVETTTAESGTFRLGPLPPGRYRIVAVPTMAGIGPVERRLTLGDGEKLQVDLTSAGGY